MPHAKDVENGENNEYTMTSNVPRDRKGKVMNKGKGEE